MPHLNRCVALAPHLTPNAGRERCTICGVSPSNIMHRCPPTRRTIPRRMRNASDKPCERQRRGAHSMPLSSRGLVCRPHLGLASCVAFAAHAALFRLCIALAPHSACGQRATQNMRHRRNLNLSCRNFRLTLCVVFAPRLFVLTLSLTNSASLLPTIQCVDRERRRM